MVCDMPTESEIISKIRKRVRPNRQVVIGVGDDAAVIEFSGGCLIACCDLLVEGVHFRREWAAPHLIGHKAIAAAISDVAAMGGSPKFAMVSIALPAATSAEFVECLIEGMFKVAESFEVSIIGGDTSASTGPLFIDVSVIGECEIGHAVGRSGAEVGNVIFVTGSLGASALGLLLLERGHRLEDGPKEESHIGRACYKAVKRHLVPEPRVREGRMIAEAGLATAMIDISDGLSTDLWHILDESGWGAVIHADQVPIADSVTALQASNFAIDPLRLALSSGEEYELIFTCRPEDRGRLSELSKAFSVPITAIGQIVSSKGLQLERGGVLEEIPPGGYEHMI
jgi:thiamine-monophosphate kinase